MSEQDSKILKIFRKIGDAILGVKKVPSKLKKSKSTISNLTNDRNIPSFLQNFMEKRDAGWSEYVMLKTQIVILALFGVSILLSFSLFSTLILAPIIAGLIGYLTYLTPTQLKPAFKRDYPAYRTLVILSIIFSLAIVFSRKFLMGRLVLIPKFPYPNLIPVILILGIFLVAIMLFRVKYGRDHTYGTVQKTKGDKAVVKIKYDLKSNVKNGIYLLETLEKVEQGDKVKVAVDRPLLGIRGSEPKTILEKTKK